MKRSQPLSPSKEQKPFERWITSNRNINVPVKFEVSYHHLQNPLEFIKASKRDALQKDLEVCRQELNNEKAKVSQFSNTLYKKVVSRDVAEYKFGNKFIEETNQMTTRHWEQLERIKEQKTKQKGRESIKREQLMKKFWHGNDLNKSFNDENKGRITNIQAIKAIGTPDFIQKHKRNEYYQLFSSQKSKQEHYLHPYDDISQNSEIDELFSKLRFPLISQDNMYGPKSSLLLFKVEEEMQFWRKAGFDEIESDQLEIIKRCHNFAKHAPTSMNLLEYSSSKINGEILNKYEKIKIMHATELSLDAMEDKMEEEYKKKTEEYQLLKALDSRDKTKTFAVKYIDNITQTIDVMEETSFDSYFQQNTKDIFLKLKDCNQLRNNAIGQAPSLGFKLKTMLINIGYEIKELLFRLLCKMFHGQQFPEYTEYFAIDNHAQAEKKILELIYHSFHLMKRPEVDGISKLQLVSIYLDQREKNDKMFELIERVLPPNAMSGNPV